MCIRGKNRRGYYYQHNLGQAQSPIHFTDRFFYLQPSKNKKQKMQWTRVGDLKGPAIPSTCNGYLQEYSQGELAAQPGTRKMKICDC